MFKYTMLTSYNHTAQKKSKGKQYDFLFNIVKTKLISLPVFAICYFISVSYAYAAVSCQPIYGGGETCIVSEGVSINKTVMNPVTKKMADNLALNDPRYAPNQLVTFQIAVANTTSTTISHINIVDTFPQFTLFNSGPGSLNSSANTLTLGVDNLNPNETRTFTLVGKVVSLDKLPSSQMVTCVLNLVTATTNTNTTSQDHAQFCIEKKVPLTKGGFPVLSPVPVTTTPSTGPEALALFSLIPAGLTGWFLRKHALRNGRKEN